MRKAEKSGIEVRFFRSLCGDAADFSAFCASDIEDYRMYRLRGFSSCTRLRYAFCEKETILGERMTAVFFAHGISDFHSLMSPSSTLLKTSADVLASELIAIKSSAESGSSRLSAEAFSVASRIPYLCEAIFEQRERARYCSVLDVTKAAVDNIALSPSFTADFNVREKRRPTSDGIIEIPVEAYAAVLTAVTNIASFLSSDHAIDVTVAFYSYAADVTVTTRTEKIAQSVRLSSLRTLIHAGIREELVRMTETIAYIAGIELSLSFDRPSGEISFVIGVGYEMQSIPDFKFSDPFEFISAVCAEIGSLVSSI